MQAFSKFAGPASRGLMRLRFFSCGSSTTPSWRSRAVFHDQAVLTAYAGVCQVLQVPKPVEETRRIGDEYVHTVQFDGGERVFEARGRNKRQARKEAIRRLLEAIAPEISESARNEISFNAAQQLVLAHSKTGASSINVKYEPVDETEAEKAAALENKEHSHEHPKIKAEVSFGEFSAEGVGESNLIARVVAFDKLIEKLEEASANCSMKDLSAGAEAASNLGSERNMKASLNKASSALRASMMISRHNTTAQRMKQNSDFHYETVTAGALMSDGVAKIPEGHTHQCTVVWSDGEYAEGTGRNKSMAKAKACEEMLVKREVIDSSLTEEELSIADDPNKTPDVLETLRPVAWELFLPQMWKEKASDCVNYLVNRTPDQGYMPVGLWEQLITDTAARGANDYCADLEGLGGGTAVGWAAAEDQLLMQKKEEIKDLCRVKIEGEFLNEGGATYFHKWRGYLGIEEYAMYESGKELVEDLGPFTVGSSEQWPSIKLEGVFCDSLHVDDLLLVRGRPCRVTSLRKPNDGAGGNGSAQVKLLDPREDDLDLFQDSSEVFAAQFGMAVPNERMVRAVKSFAGFSPPEYEPQQPVSVADWLQDVLVNPTGIGFGAEFDHSSAIAEPVQCLENIPLSESQKSALEAATSRRLTLIQGPPGTGKTYCGAAIVASYAAANPNARILACADSNIAADNLCNKIQQLSPDLRVVRVGDGGSEELRNQVLAGEAISGYGAKELRLLRMEALRRQLPTAQVVVATCVGSGMEVMDQAPGYDFCVVDEASQALEPATLVALERAGPEVKHVVLIGDHKQLPATVLSNDPNIAVSLFQRMADKGVDPLMLLEQRRMHSLIAEFPNETFYNGRLINATKDEDLMPITNTVELVHVAPADISGNEVKRGESTCNQAEAKVLCDYLEKNNLIDRDDISIGVLTPYAAQKHVLQDMLFNRGLLRDHIRVDTIDGFQGMERDIIVFSATRSNPRGDLGFLKDPRRMNVMLTRAKKSLVVFADASCLRSSSFSHWARWVEWVQSKGTLNGDELPSGFSSDWSGRNQRREQNEDSFQDAFGSSNSTASTQAGVPEESDFLKMLRANQNNETSFQSGSANLSWLPGSSEEKGSKEEEVKMYSADKTKIGRAAKKAQDPSTRQKHLSDEDFERLLNDDSFGGDGTKKPSQDSEFLAMLDNCAKNEAAKN